MYTPANDRYEKLTYHHCGKSGLKLPRLSIGLWHNFGDITPFGVQQSILRTAFDNGITHFDLANNYGPPYGEAERNFGIHMDRDWHTHRDELIITTKAGHEMWPGPYGDFGSRKSLMASIDQSLKRMHLDYVDIFYHHRPDPNTPIEETMQTLYDIVKSGKALYVGISKYGIEDTKKAIKILNDLGIHLLVNQQRYSMFTRSLEEGLDKLLMEEGVGCIVFSPLERGILSNRYLNGIPSDSRAGHDPRYLKPSDITQEKIEKVRKLNTLAAQRGQSLAQTALAWVLRNPAVTSAIIGASRPEQVTENLAALQNLTFTDEELNKIDNILADK